MEISFSTAKLKKIFESKQKLKSEYGDRCASKIMIRIGVLLAAGNLDQIPKVNPDRCHELRNDRKGTFAIDLLHPFRLIIKPDMDEILRLEDGGINLKKVTKIQILSVEDYHS